MAAAGSEDGAVEVEGESDDDDFEFHDDESMIMNSKRSLDSAPILKPFKMSMLL